MSTNVNYLQLENFIVSKLWYTAHVVHRTKSKKNISNDNDAVKLCTSIGCFDYSKKNSWIIHKLLAMFENNEVKEHSLNLIQLEKALYLIDKNVPETIEQELLKLHEAVTTTKEESDECLINLSVTTLKYLETKLKRNSALTHWIIEQLLCIWSTKFSSTDSDLQDLYSKVIVNIIQEKSTPTIILNDYQSLILSPKNVNLLDKQSLASLLCILSKFDITESKEKKLTSWLWSMLLTSCKFEDIELALFSRKDLNCFRMWHKYLEELNSRNKSICNLENALNIFSAIFNMNESSFIQLNSHEVLIRVLKNKSHWLSDLLEICYIFIMNDRLDDLTKILKNSSFDELWLPFLFKCLENCLNVKYSTSNDLWKKNSTISSSLRFILQNCKLQSMKDPVLNRLEYILESHLDAWDYIIMSKESIENKTSGSTNQNLNPLQIFHHLQDYSILSTIKTMVPDIHDKSFKQIFSLLKDSSESKIVYQAYSALLNALKAILSCNFYNDKFGAIAIMFNDMEEYINTLYPLNLRLEVLEDIFSMMFLRHEYFSAEENTIDCDAENDDDDDDNNYNHKLPSPSRKHSGQYYTGFICNKYAIRETLHYIRKCIFVVNNECTRLKTDSDTSEDLELIQKRISSLQIYCNEAAWRLELLTNPEFLKNQGLPDVEQKNNICNHKLNLSIYQHIKCNLYKVDDSSSDEPVDLKSDIDVSSESSMGNITDSGKRRRRLKNNKFIESSESKNIKQIKEFTLNYMLASKETLVLKCLWKDDYTQAQYVIKTFNMEDSHLAGEISFSEALRKFRLEIDKQLTQKTSKNKLKMDSKHSTIDFIRKAAEDGIQATRITSQVETFLASQEPNIILSSDFNNAKDIMTLVTVDFALTMGHDNQTSENLSEITMKHLKSSKKLQNSHFYKFFETIYQLYYEQKNSSIQKILCDARIPLSIYDYRNQCEYWNNFHKKLKTFEKKTKLIDTIMNKNDKNNRKKKIDEILLLCNNGEVYLHRLNAHLDLIESIAPSFEEINSNLQFKPFLLENSIDSYIGYQIFDLNINLESLEIFANQLQINLAYCILSNCCPKLLCNNNNNNNNSNDHQIKNSRWGIIVLNKYENYEEFTNNHLNDPNQFIIELLSELNQALQDYIDNSSFTEIELKAICKTEKIANVLKKTSHLINCDLSHLSCGDHTLAFFVNIWNLMMLHTILEIWSQDPPTIHLHHAISCSTIGYIIGDLGFVTLFTLRSKLLGQSLCLGFESLGFEYPEELNEPAWLDLDLQQDPRVIFAMINEYQRSPIIKIYHPDTLNEDLNVATRDYLGHYCNQEKMKIFNCPKLIEKYKELLDNSEDTKINLENYVNTDENIEYEPFKYLYDIRWKYSQEKSFDENNEINKNNLIWRNRTIKSSILQYLEGHCWLLSYLVQRIHKENPTIYDSSCDNLDRMAILENLFKSLWAQNLKCLFGDNSVVAGLQNYSSTTELWHYFEILMKNQKLKKCLTILNSLPDSLVINNAEIQSFRDKVLTCLIDNKEELAEMEILQYLYQIKDIHVLTQVVLSKVKTWPARICEEALRHVLNHVNSNHLPTHCRSKMSEILCRVLVFDKMLIYCKLEDDAEVNWYNVVYRTETTDPTKIVKSLIDANQYELCLEWMEYQTPSLEIQSLVSQDLFMGLLKNEKDNFKHARKLLMALPVGLLIKLCKGVIEKLESMNALRFVVKYLLENSSTERKKYQKIFLGVEILDQLDLRDKPLYMHLINEPLLILEQLLMNGKFDNLQKIISNSSELFKLANFCIEDFDKIVRFYAQKSLDFKGVTVQRDVDNKSKDGSPNKSGEFIMPVKIPSKEDWIPDEKARECSCCKTVIFSMFNRRHHCRRCGRVVCASCSAQRMKIPGYIHSVLVRVCNDCKHQATVQDYGVPSTISSESYDYWKLTNDEAHNKILREEFCFEYAPNISLCLAILNLHSDHKTYASFLLDQCENMKDLLTPDKNGRVNSEVDHGLIIQMIRTLLVAAKFKYAELGLNTGLTYCDKFLSQVDLIATLVRSDCLSLIPTEHINDHTFRRLRDLLTEKEQWRLALDVSTKSGLQTQGVWAAWGKACLKVGYYESAREKFAYCFDKIHQEDSEVYQDWVLLPHSEDVKESQESNDDKQSVDKNKKKEKVRETLKNRPSKDPPLLQEILQILEISNFGNQYSQQSTTSKNSMAQEILNTLNNLKAISHGQYNLSKSNSSIQNCRYQESLYYLLMYGSYFSILEFFVRYGELEKCLLYILENDLEPELFFNAVFLECLKNGSMTNLFTTMKTMDENLLMWKKYLIFTCHSLEKKQLFNTLYQLQLFMKDYVRAAMTCIRFYVMDVSNYADICLRNHFLLNAQKHLEVELQGESFGKSRRKSVSSSQSGQTGLTMEMEPSEIDKHINTISRQMEIAKFLGACEKEGRSVNEFLSKLSFMDGEGLQPRNVPTLFGNQQERTHLAVLAILCGINVEEGFGVAFRVMQDYNLRPQKVYSLVGHILVRDKKINSIEQLIKCCRSSGAPNSNAISDRVLTHCIKFLIERLQNEVDSLLKDQINSLIKLITDIELKIGSYIESKQLKAAYLLAVKHSRAQDIRRILNEADRLGQSAIKSICTKWLQNQQ